MKPWRTFTEPTTRKRTPAKPYQPAGRSRAVLPLSPAGWVAIKSPLRDRQIGRRARTVYGHRPPCSSRAAAPRSAAQGADGLLELDEPLFDPPDRPEQLLFVREGLRGP